MIKYDYMDNEKILRFKNELVKLLEVYSYKIYGSHINDDIIVEDAWNQSAYIFRNLDSGIEILDTDLEPIADDEDKEK